MILHLYNANLESTVFNDPATITVFNGLGQLARPYLVSKRCSHTEPTGSRAFNSGLAGCVCRPAT